MIPAAASVLVTVSVLSPGTGAVVSPRNSWEYQAVLTQTLNLELILGLTRNIKK